MIRLGMKRRVIIVLIVLWFITSISVFIKNKMDKGNFPEKSIYVGDKKTAISIAKSIWLPTCGKKVLDEKLFHATLKNDSIWAVEGVLNEGKDSVAAYAEIQKKDGKILKIVHYR
jgi:hypothetical protein